MACAVVAMTKSDACSATDGGIKESRIAKFSDITTVVFTAGDITNFVMTTTGLWKKFQFDTVDDTAYFNQEGERTGNKHIYNQTAFLKFGGITLARVKSAESLKDCCELVAIHLMNNGLLVAQGLELVGTDEWSTTKKPLMATVNIMTGTGTEEDRIEISLISQSKQAAKVLPIAMTLADIDAL